MRAPRMRTPGRRIGHGSRGAGRPSSRWRRKAARKNRHRRAGKYRDLPARGARDHLGFGVEQRRRIESQDTLFIGHVDRTLATPCGLSKKPRYLAERAHTGCLAPISPPPN